MPRSSHAARRRRSAESTLGPLRHPVERCVRPSTRRDRWRYTRRAPEAALRQASCARSRASAPGSIRRAPARELPQKITSPEVRKSHHWARRSPRQSGHPRLLVCVMSCDPETENATRSRHSGGGHVGNRAAVIQALREQSVMSTPVARGAVDNSGCADHLLSEQIDQHQGCVALRAEDRPIRRHA